MYREQCLTLEEELAKIREEGDVGREIFKVMPLAAADSFTATLTCCDHPLCDPAQKASCRALHL